MLEQHYEAILQKILEILNQCCSQKSEIEKDCLWDDSQKVSTQFFLMQRHSF